MATVAGSTEGAVLNAEPMETPKKEIQTVGVAFHHMAARLGAFGRLNRNREDRKRAAAFMAECGINMYAYGCCWDQEPPAGFAEFVEDVQSCGVAVSVALRDMGGGEFTGQSNDGSRRICATSERQLGELERNVRAYFDCGVMGWSYLADDLEFRVGAEGRLDGSHCPRCSDQYDGQVAGEHVRILGILLALHHEFGLDTAPLFCPPMYHGLKTFQQKHARCSDPYGYTVEYFKTIHRFAREHAPSLKVYVTRFERPDLDDYAALGVDNVAYWCNTPRGARYWSLKGRSCVWPAFEGYPEMYSGWIQWFGPGQRPNPAMRDIRDLTSRTDTAVVCVHTWENSICTNEYVWLGFGALCRDPKAFDPELHRREAIKILWGGETGAAMDAFDREYRQALDLVQQYVTGRMSHAELRNDLSRRCPALRSKFAELQSIFRSEAEHPLPQAWYREEMNLIEASLDALEDPPYDTEIEEQQRRLEQQ